MIKASMDILTKLSQRASLGAKYLAQPAPTADCIEKAMRYALCAPDHAGLHPARIVLIENTKKLSRLFAEEAIAAGACEEDAQKAAGKATKAPALFAIIVRIDSEHEKVPAAEQWMTAGAFASNFLVGLELEGYAGKIVSGGSTRYESVRQTLCREGEVIAAWLMAGTPVTHDGHAVKERAPSDNYFSVWC